MRHADAPAYLAKTPPLPATPPPTPTPTPTPDFAQRVTVLVVSYNSAHCLPALGRSLAGLPWVTLIDNASHDDTLAATAQHLPQARVLALPNNLGFGAANNQGWRAAQTEFVLLLNPDCVCDAGAIAALVRCADAQPEASVIAPQLLDRRGAPDISYRWRAGWAKGGFGGASPVTGGASPVTGWASRGPGAEAPCCVGFVSGAAMLIRRSALAVVQGFDEAFFLYYEDEDLCLRLQDQCGPIVVEPAAQIQHLSRASVGGKHRLRSEYLRGFHHIQSKFLFKRKHGGQAVGSLRRGGYALGGAAEALLRLLLLDPQRAARCVGRVAGVLLAGQ